MPRLPSANRYAQAAFQVALERDRLDLWAQDLATMAGVLGDPGAKTFLELPGVAFREKDRLVRDVLKDTDPLVQNMASLLVSRGLLDLVPRIHTRFQLLVDSYRGREHGEVTTAVPLNDGDLERVSRYLKDLVGKEVVLSSKVNPDILGGVIARVGDRVVDGSMRNRLRELAKTLKESVPIYSQS